MPPAELRGVVVHEWQGGVQLGMRMGVHSGELVTTAYGPIGRPVYLCSRLCHSAGPGQTLVSEVTRSVLGDSDLGGIFLVDMGERELHGARLRVYEIRDGAP